MVLEKDHPYAAFISQPDLKHDRLEHLRAQPSQHAGQAAADDIYMGKIARQAASNPLRQSIFLNEGLDIRKPIGKLRRGRPRQRWGPSVMNNCLEVAGSTVRLAELFRPERGADVAWQSAVRAVY